MYNLKILPQATLSIRNSAQWYNKQKEGLGKKFTLKVREKAKSLKNNPLHYEIKYNGIRTAIVEVFPYLIHFYIDQERNTIVVLDVLSMHRSSEVFPTK